MPRFPSADWLDAYVDRINSSAEFRSAARDFRATISYVFEAEAGALDRDIWARAVVGDGCCSWWRYDITPEAGSDSEFVLRAPYSLWKDVIGGELDPMEAMLDGDLAVTGHLPTLLRYVRAANELVTLASAVSTEFADQPAA